MRSEYKKNTVFYHKTKNIFMIVHSVEFHPTKGGKLYRIKVLSNNDKEGDWKAYYQQKIDNECIEVDTKQLSTISLLYGS